jgi:class 3 adenylate cyclase
MQPDIQALQAAINALQAQRALLGDAVVDAAVAPLKARIDLLSRAAQQLRLVSVLFLDITGSTSLTQHLDPEDVHEVMDGALSRFASLVKNKAGACCSSPATACWPPLAATARAKTMPNAPCAPAWPCWKPAATKAAVYRRVLGIPVLMCAWACTPAWCCWVAAWTKTAASAA